MRSVGKVPGVHPMLSVMRDSKRTVTGLVLPSPAQANVLGYTVGFPQNI